MIRLFRDAYFGPGVKSARIWTSRQSWGNLKALRDTHSIALTTLGHCGFVSDEMYKIARCRPFAAALRVARVSLSGLCITKKLEADERSMIHPREAPSRSRSGFFLYTNIYRQTS